MAEHDSDQTEAATPHKLEQARKRGSVPKSADLNTFAIVATATLALFALADGMLRGIARIVRRVLAEGVQVDWSADGVAYWMGRLLADSLDVLGPLFMAIVVVAVAASLAQTGPVFSATPLVPDFSRLNPANGLKKFFSMRAMYETVKSLLKFLLISAAAYFFIESVLRGLFSLALSDARGYLPALLELSRNMMVKLLLVLLLVALADFIFSRWEFARQMRMSRRDIKDEIKHREGDPRIRSRLRELRMEMLKRTQATQNVAKADVLITNPTHLAVALSYREGQAEAPKVIAKGAGELAHRMREIAYRKGITVVENRRLARALYAQVGFGELVPEAWYPEVARILVWVFMQREAGRRPTQVAA